MTWPVPPGWYPDPSGAPGARFWDGAGWTNRVTPPPPGPLPYSHYPIDAHPMPPQMLPARFDWGYQPVVVYGSPELSTGGVPLSRRSGVVGGVLQMFFGWHGLGRFYLGYTGIGCTQLALGLTGLITLFLCYIGILILVPLTIWVEIEAIMMIGGWMLDADGRKLR